MTATNTLGTLSISKKVKRSKSPYKPIADLVFIPKARIRINHFAILNTFRSEAA